MRGNLPVFEFPALRAAGVDVFVTGRRGGVSTGPYDSLNLGTHVGDDVAAVQENRSRVAWAIGVSSDRLVFVHQVHGVDVVDARDVNVDTAADAIYLTESTLAVAIMVADCVPVVMANPVTRELVVVHAGWRGLAAGVLAAAVATLSGPSSSWWAGIGPSISGASYQVGPEVARAFAHIPGAVREDVGDRSLVDLHAVTAFQLAQCGLESSRIVLSPMHTDGGDTFFSDRHQRPCGRFALVARWP